MRDLMELNKYRDYAFELQVYGWADDSLRSDGGVFFVPTKGSRRGLKIIASSAKCSGSHGWDHVSISLPNRCPTWEEMDKIKRLFFLPHEVCFQLHPAESENISNHNYCLHIWRPTLSTIPLPPEEMVGNASYGTIKQGQIDLSTAHKAQEDAARSLTNAPMRVRKGKYV